jgi:hypothetical protein
MKPAAPVTRTGACRKVSIVCRVALRLLMASIPILRLRVGGNIVPINIHKGPQTRSLAAGGHVME